MSISKEAIQKILGLGGNICITPEEMLGRVKVTFFPIVPENISQEVKYFSEELKATLSKLGVEVIPFEDTLVSLPKGKIIKWYFFAFLNRLAFLFEKLINKENKKVRPDFEILSKLRKGKRVKKGIAIISMGEGQESNLPIDYTMSFRESFVVTILDMPSGIDENTDFQKHFDISMRLFVHNMAQIVIAVDKEKILLYNLNGAHTTYPRNGDLQRFTMKTLIPKLAAPISPPRLSEFIIQQETFDPSDDFHKKVIADFQKSADFFDKSGLYPKGKSLEELPFRNEFYRWVGRIFLDDRTGMSYGFLAHQMPTKIPPLISLEQTKYLFKGFIEEDKDYFMANDHDFVIINLRDEKYCIEIPDVWVMTLRSGANKTNFDTKKDLIELGLVNGKMILRSPMGLKINTGYRPSFDTKVILAHAVGNALVAAILLHINPNHPFPKMLLENGLAICHWHGYFKKDSVPKNWHIYGLNNPSVACSTPQSGIYALAGKINALMEAIESNKEYEGDIHIEPHHGTNIVFPSLTQLGNFILKNPDMVALGNRYFKDY